MIITAIITGVLLQGQSDAERLQKEQAEIFKEKLATYNRFLDALCKYVTDSTEHNKKVLIFHTMSIKMHCDANVVERFNSCATRVIAGAGTDGKKATKELVETLNEIASLFRAELYGDDNASGHSPSISLESFVDAITGSQEEPTRKEADESMKEDEAEDNARPSTGLISWGG
mgnify:CR=1 FL=1